MLTRLEGEVTGPGGCDILAEGLRRTAVRLYGERGFVIFNEMIVGFFVLETEYVTRFGFIPGECRVF
ncbi:MAG: hypothetical protein JW864_09635 [Spirochaetes bacterium]|nr:hypothetical protein [Spirochaetota bacterium]